MKRVIKASENCKVQLFVGQPSLPRPPDLRSPASEEGGTSAETHSDAAVRALEQALSRSERETELLQRQFEEAITRSESLQADAYERGKREGLHQSDEETSHRLDLLARTMQAATVSFAENIAQVELLALQLAKAALGRVIGDTDSHHVLLQQLIAFQIERFSQDQPTCLRVAQADFPDVAALARIASDWPDLNLTIDSKLAPGECLISLALGEVEIGLPGQAERMGAYFTSLIAEREAPVPAASAGSFA